MKLNTGFSMTLGVCNANIQGRELPLRGHFLSITSSIISTLWKSIVFRYFIDVRNQRPLDIGRFRGLSISWRNAKTRPVTSSTSPRRNKEKSGRNPPGGFSSRQPPVPGRVSLASSFQFLIREFLWSRRGGVEGEEVVLGPLGLRQQTTHNYKLP